MTTELVHIRFLDPEVFDGEWTDPSSIADDEPRLLHAVGFLIHQDQDVYVLASMWDPENEMFNAIQRYPRGCVKRLTPLGLLKCLMT